MNRQIYKPKFARNGMKIEIVNQGKDDVEFKIDNSTVAEIMRVYLNVQGVKLAVWRREHPFKPFVMKIQTTSGTVKKAVSDSVAAIKKELGVFLKR